MNAVATASSGIARILLRGCRGRRRDGGALPVDDPLDLRRDPVELLPRRGTPVVAEGRVLAGLEDPHEELEAAEDDEGVDVRVRVGRERAARRVALEQRPAELAIAR